MPSRPAFLFQAPEAENYIDKLAFAQLRKLQTNPSPVCDDTTFVGSFNLSHSGEMNAENVLEFSDAGLAEQLAGFVDSVRARYPAVSLPVL